MKIRDKKHLESLLSPSGRIRRNASVEERSAIFILWAEEIHGLDYNYSKVAYVNSEDKVAITCPMHGEFTQLVRVHLRGHGCPSCASNSKVTYEEFVSRASYIHNDKYSYAEGSYIGTNYKASIVCPTHGIFHQRVSDHINGHGCPKCPYTPQDTLYLWKFKGLDLYKIGISSEGNLEDRINRVAREHNAVPEILVTENVKVSIKSLETDILKQLSNMYDKPITFGAGYTEIFSIPESDVSELILHIQLEVKEHIKKYNRINADDAEESRL